MHLHSSAGLSASLASPAQYRRQTARAASQPSHALSLLLVQSGKPCSAAARVAS